MGFTDRDYADTRRPRRHRSFTLPSDPPVPVYRWVQRTRLDPVLISRDPEIVDLARDELTLRLDRHATDHGLTVLEVNWATVELADPHQLELELAAKLVPRTDGEWASIRAAIEEDQADRELAAQVSDDATLADLTDRFDALKETVGVWSAKTPFEVREALGVPFLAARHPAEGNRPPSPITRDVRDRDLTR